MDVSVIIVSYNTKDLLKNCLESIFNYTRDVEFEVIVVDNGSSDDSVRMVRDTFQKVILVENKQNLGFGAANNRGLSIAKGKYVFYLNSDTILLNNAVKIFFDYWEGCSDDLGVIGCNLVNDKLNATQSFGSFPTKKNIYKALFLCLLDSVGVKKYLKEIFTHNVGKLNYCIGDVDYVMGADMFLLNNKIASFDEDFFLFFEETELQYQMYRLNKIRRLIDGPKIIHLGGGSSDKSKNYSFYSKSSKFFWKSCLIYLKKRNQKCILLKNVLRLIYIRDNLY